MVATIPADLIQLQWNALMMAQKLAYLYGWPDLLENGNVDEQTELELTLLFGTMTGVAAAERGLAEIARPFAGQVFRRLPRQALTKTVYYPIAKQVAKWIGISLTKRGFAGGLRKSHPGNRRGRVCRSNSRDHAANGQAPEEPPAGTEICTSR